MKSLKKNVSIVAMLVVIGTSSMISVNASAASSSNCNSTFTVGKLCYKVGSNNTCSVVGLSNKGQNSTSCTIPSTVTCNGTTYKVTNISKNAFNDCDNIKSVFVSNNVKTIGANAFKDCDNLKSVSLGSKVNKVGSNAFSSCDRLKTIKSTKKITSLGKNCFGNATYKFSK